MNMSSIVEWLHSLLYINGFLGLILGLPIYSLAVDKFWLNNSQTLQNCINDSAFSLYIASIHADHAAIFRTEKSPECFNMVHKFTGKFGIKERMMYMHGT